MHHGAEKPLPLRRCLPPPSGSNKMCEDPVDLSTFWIPFPIPSVPLPPSFEFVPLGLLPATCWREKEFWTGAVQTGPSAFSLKEWCLSNAASYCLLSSSVTCLRKRRVTLTSTLFSRFPEPCLPAVNLSPSQNISQRRFDRRVRLRAPLSWHHVYGKAPHPAGSAAG